MKTFTKVIIIISSILIFLGFITVAVAIGLGAKFHDNSFYNTYNFSNTYTDVTSLKVNIGVGKVTIKEGDEFKVEATDVIKGRFNSYVESGVLTINENYSSKGILNFIFKFGKDISIISYSPKITIYVPKDFEFDDTRISIGTGVGIVDKLNTNKLIISVGTGELTINNLQSNSSNIDCGVGSVKINGIMLGDNKIDNGVGNITLDLIGNEDDYNYKYSVGLGTVTINGSKFSKGSSNGKVDNNASNNFDIDCGIGNVKIEIKEYENEE
jgi:hypothetical protein